MRCSRSCVSIGARSRSSKSSVPSRYSASSTAGTTRWPHPSRKKRAKSASACSLKAAGASASTAVNASAHDENFGRRIERRPGEPVGNIRREFAPGAVECLRSAMLAIEADRNRTTAKSIVDRALRAVAQRLGELAERIGLACTVKLDAEHQFLGREAIARSSGGKHDAAACGVAGVGIAAVVAAESGLSRKHERVGMARLPIGPSRVNQCHGRELLAFERAAD